MFGIAIDPNLLLQCLAGILGILGILLGKRVSTYMQQGTRTAQFNEITGMAFAVLSFLELRGAVGADAGTTIKQAITMLRDWLVASRKMDIDTATQIATQAVAGAAATKNYDLKAIPSF